MAKASLEGITLTPSALSRVQDFDQLAMSADIATANLEPGKGYMAQVRLQDGRQLKVPVTVDPPRPQVTLLNKGVQEEEAAAGRRRCAWKLGRPAAGWEAGVLPEVAGACQLSAQ